MNRMIQKLALLLVLLMSTYGMNANPVDMRTAREVAVKFVNANTQMPLRGSDELQLVTTYNISRGDAAFYVFNTSNGFVIVSADDCATPVLGYSDEGQFDTEDIPIQLRGYLQDFVEQIQFGIENHLEADEAIARQWESVQTMGCLVEQRAATTVAPMLTSHWNQRCYYNNCCPIEPNGPCGHAPVGCVATAFAQIMHYWGYPSIGTGSHTYTQSSGYPTQTANFGATIYDWAHMPNALSSSSTSTEINAVATLMWHCGVAVDMIYYSGAAASDLIFVAPAFVNYFDYSDDLSLVSRDDYSDEEWLTMMKDCLDLGRPINYGGSGSGGGHSFVCDGYDSNDMLHFNWGWGGSFDGYFALGALNPGGYAFNTFNRAIINIHPKCESGTTYQVTGSVSPSNGGTVYGAGNYDCNTLCTLTAEPDEGFVFCSWTENGVLVSAEPTYSFNVTEDRSLVANFAAVGSACNVVFDLHDTFANGWSDNYLVIDYGNGITEQLTLDGGSSASFLRAVMTGSLVSLSWISGSYINDCSFDVSYDNGIPIYHAENLSSDFQYAFSVDCEAAYAARVVSVIADPEEGGVVSGAGTFEVGSICTVVAVPNEGYYFANWTKNGSVVSTDLTYSFAVMEGSVMVAHFVTGGNIVFADDNVKALCVQNWDTNEDGELSYVEAAAVTSLGEVFSYNSEITSFEELQYFIGLSSINENAFSSCTNLTSVTIPNSVTIIGNGAFDYCYNLTGPLIIPNAVTWIGDSAFGWCSGLTGSLTIPNTVTWIGDWAFGLCSGLTGNLTIPNSVTWIGYGAFDGCSGFTGSLTIPNSVTWIGDDAFYGCSGFTGSLTIPNSITSIGGWTFGGCSGLTGSLTIPNSVTSIGNYAFYNCSGLTASLTIPNSVTSIGEYAFYGCTGFFGQMTIGDAVTSIGDNAFYYCIGMNSVVVLPLEPPTIGTDVFPDNIPIYVLCEALKTYQLAAGWNALPNLMGMCSPGTVSVIVDPIEGGTVSGAGTYESGTSCAVIATPNEGYCFISWTEDGSVVSYDSHYSFIVTGETVLKAHFAMVGNIVFVDANVKARCVAHWDTNGDGELSYAEAAMVTDLGTAFRNDNSLTSFDELQYFTGLTSIGDMAFMGCYGLTSIVLPNSLLSIESHAFWNCWGLNTITIPNSVTYIGGSAFYDCSRLTSMTIPSSVTTIMGNPFVYCTGLDRIIVEAGNTVYDSRNNCNAIIKTSTNELTTGCKNTVIPNTVTSIGASAFSNCTTLTSIVIPNSVVCIEEQAFNFCTGLTSLTIPNSITSIRNRAFYYCANLASIRVFAETPPSLGTNAFYGVNKSIPLYVPCASVDAYRDAVGWNEFTNRMGMCPGTITITASPVEGGTVTGGGYYEGGAICILTATANTGYMFLNWSKDGEVVSCNATYSFVVTEDADLEAVFMPFDGALIGQGESTTTLLPSHSAYNYALSQQIYTPDDIDTVGSIVSMAYFNAGGPEVRNFDIYMVYTDKTVFSDNTDWITVSELDRVFSGVVNMVTGYWTTIVLDTPFFYDGSSNLAVVVDDNTGEYTGAPHMACRVFDAQGEQAIRVISDDTDYDPYNPSAYSGIRHTVKNQMILGFAPFPVQQTIALSSGTNWVSFYVNTNLDALKAALEPIGASVTDPIIIQANGVQTLYNGTRWRGALNALNLAQMYKITVPVGCEIELEGVPLDPSELSITIKKGANWIGFPFQQSMTVTEAFAGLPPVNGDVVRTKNGGQATYTNQWRGALNELVPGVGYIYNSASTENRTFTFPTGAK